MFTGILQFVPYHDLSACHHYAVRVMNYAVLSWGGSRHPAYFCYWRVLIFYFVLLAFDWIIKNFFIKENYPMSNVLSRLWQILWVEPAYFVLNADIDLVAG